MEWNVRLILCLSAFLIHSITADEVDQAEKVKIKPQKYYLKIFTKEEHFKDGDIAKMTFDGSVTIDFIVEKPNESFNEDFFITLNTNPNMKERGMKITEDNEDKTSLCTTSTTSDTYTLKCQKSLLTSKIKSLTIEFSNKFGNDMTGFYRSSYKVGSETRYLLTTHFEPIFARKAFPCFDLPDLKAKFQIEITAPAGYKTVLSNTPVKGEPKQNSDNSITYTFEETPIPMSTYLVAFTVSDFSGTKVTEFSSLDGKTKKPLKTYGRKDLIERGDAAKPQEIGKLALEGLAKYLDMDYKFQKVDQIGIPDFSAGAMENFGHISFREKALYINDKSSTNTKQSNILTITHELVHQWFGNLVTLSSWNYIWLNEAFANYLEYVIANQFSECSSWKLMDQMVVNEIHLRAFETDGFNTAKPLNQDIKDENLIYGAFNDIPYAKGSAVLRMMEYFMRKKEDFQNSLKNYIKKMAEKASSPKDLFESFKEVSGMPEHFFKSWTEQPGYPVIEVKKSEKGYVLSQTPFFWEKSDNEQDNRRLYSIVVSYSSDTEKKFDLSNRMFLQNDGKPLTINKTFKWIVVNDQQAGYFRVNYEKENWLALTEALNQSDHSKIPELNRAQIINDIYSLARSLQKNYVDYSLALNLTTYLKKEKSFIPWKSALHSFDFLKTKLYQDEIYDKFRTYVLDLLKPLFKPLNSVESDHIQKLMHSEISRWACNLDLQECVENAKTLFKNNEYEKYPDTREIVLCTAVKTDKTAWSKVFDMYKKEEDSSTKLMYLSALGCSNDEATINEYLSKTLSDNPDVRKQDLTYVLSSVYSGNLKNVELALKFIEAQFEKIAINYGGINPLGRAFLGISKKLTTKNHVERMEKLVEKVKKSDKCKEAVENAENALKLVRSNLKWADEKMKSIRSYFNSGSLASISMTLLLTCIFAVFRF